MNTQDNQIMTWRCSLVMNPRACTHDLLLTWNPKPQTSQPTNLNSTKRQKPWTPNLTHLVYSLKPVGVDTWNSLEWRHFEYAQVMVAYKTSITYHRFTVSQCHTLKVLLALSGSKTWRQWLLGIAPNCGSSWH
jgi:hypothetical protein